MVTSIQIHEDTKAFLNNFKKGKESYDDIIKKLAKFYNEKKKTDEKILEDAYKENAKYYSEEDKEWIKFGSKRDWPEW